MELSVLLETAPGLDRGLKGAKPKNLTGFLSSTSDPIKSAKYQLESVDEDESAKPNNATDAASTTNEVDELLILPSSDTEKQTTTTQIQSTQVKKQYAHMVNINDAFTDFHTLVPDVTLHLIQRWLKRFHLN